MKESMVHCKFQLHSFNLMYFVERAQDKQYSKWFETICDFVNEKASHSYVGQILVIIYQLSHYLSKEFLLIYHPLSMGMGEVNI